MNEQIQKARRLIAAVMLTDVRLTELVAKTSIRASDITEDMLPTFQHSASVATGGIKDSVFYVRANLDLRIGSEAKHVVSVKIQYELEYSLPGDFKATRAELNAFAQVNGVFNAWPYFREIIQTAIQRMNLPPVILPVYRVPHQAPAKKTAPD